MVEQKRLEIRHLFLICIQVTVEQKKAKNKTHITKKGTWLNKSKDNGNEKKLEINKKKINLLLL